MGSAGFVIDSSIVAFTADVKLMSIVSSVSSPGAFKSSSIPFKEIDPDTSPANTLNWGASW